MIVCHFCRKKLKMNKQAISRVSYKNTEGLTEFTLMHTNCKPGFYATQRLLKAAEES